jgi:putative Mn2+ efflux pump MntP
VILPLALDTFAASAALAAAGRGRAVLVAFPLAETLMTVLGLAIGVALPFEAWVGGLVLIAVGLWMLAEGDDDVRSTRPLIALALGISIDELAIGVSLGLLGVPLVAAVALVAAQAVVAAAAGYALGSRLRGTWVERVAAGTLVALGVLSLVL